MRHAQEAALDTIEDLLVARRRHQSLTERKRGAFYRKSAGFVHFHEDPAGMFADLKVDGEWKRLRVTTRREQKQFLSELASALQ
ncbi:MAG TPA: hypothetical protein VNS63_18325 [Blastocatellia bacterium]|nr:hypothetical protein [Blastocatellia bacterium]